MLQRTTILSATGQPLDAAVCLCGRTVMVRADGHTLYNHNAQPKQRCPMSRKPFRYAG